MMINTKRRDASKLTSPVILKTLFDVSSYYYDKSVQTADIELDEISSIYLDEDDDDDFSLLSDDF